MVSSVNLHLHRPYDKAVEDSQVFGFTPANEINNGRWTMFGLLVGMMTEYATGRAAQTTTPAFESHPVSNVDC